MKEIKALPSVIICDDGSRRELDSFSSKEREEITKKMSSSINRSMSDFYTHNEKEWENLIRIMGWEKQKRKSLFTELPFFVLICGLFRLQKNIW